MRLSFVLRNLDAANPLSLLSPKALTLFQRLRIVAGSVVCEDIDYLGRTISMFDRLKSPSKVMNEQITNGGAANDASMLLASGTLDAIGASDSRVMVCDLSVSGLLSQSKWLPVGLMGGGLTL